MKLHPYFIPVALALALAACRPAASEYSEADAAKDLRLDNATTHVDLHFAPGSTRLVPRDATRLRALIATGGLQPSDRVLVATGGSPGLARARFEAIANEFAPHRIVATPQPVAVGPNHAIIQSVRYLVTLPACPNWGGPGPHDFTNSPNSNFGCASQVISAGWWPPRPIWSRAVRSPLPKAPPPPPRSTATSPTKSSCRPPRPSARSPHRAAQHQPAPPERTLGVHHESSQRSQRHPPCSQEA